MKTSDRGIALIKKYEGCKLTAYKPVATEKYFTIGYGHYGPDVNPGMAITQYQADLFLLLDIEKFEKKVEKYNVKYNWTQNEFDALVSFAFNIGSIDQLTANGTRSKSEIAAKIPEYRKAGGKVLQGLVKRRAAEQAMFNESIKPNEEGPVKAVEYRLTARLKTAIPSFRRISKLRSSLVKMGQIRS